MVAFIVHVKRPIYCFLKKSWSSKAKEFGYHLLVRTVRHVQKSQSTEKKLEKANQTECICII